MFNLELIYALICFLFEIVLHRQVTVSYLQNFLTAWLMLMQNIICLLILLMSTHSHSHIHHLPLMLIRIKVRQKSTVV